MTHSNESYQLDSITYLVVDSTMLYDMVANDEDVTKAYALTITNTLPNKKFDGVVLAVAHQEFFEIDIKRLINNNAVVYDVKGVLKGENIYRL